MGRGTSKVGGRIARGSQAEFDAIENAKWSKPTSGKGTTRIDKLNVRGVGTATIHSDSDSLGQYFSLDIKMRNGGWSEHYDNSQLGNTMNSVKRFARSRMHDL